MLIALNDLLVVSKSTSTSALIRQVFRRMLENDPSKCPKRASMRYDVYELTAALTAVAPALRWLSSAQSEEGRRGEVVNLGL